MIEPNSVEEDEIHPDLREMGSVFAILKSDADLTVEYSNHFQDSDYWRKVFVRNLFADIEARLFQYRRLVLHNYDNYKYETSLLSDDEVMMLREKRCTIGDDGLIHEQPVKTRLAGNYLFTMRMAWKIHFGEYQLNTGVSTDWKNFKDAIKIRDRLMHPKSVMDLTVTSDEYEVILSVASWIDAETQRFYDLLANMREQFVRQGIFKS